MEKIVPSNESYGCNNFPLLVKNNPVVSDVWSVARVYKKKKDRLYLTLVTLGPELCQLVRVWLITEVFMMYSTE